MLDASDPNAVKFLLFRADEPTANNNVYSERAIALAIKQFVEVNIKKDRAFGETVNPQAPYKTVVNLSNVSHKITDLSYNPSTKEFVGTARIIADLPNGAKLLACLSRGEAVPTMLAMADDYCPDNTVNDFTILSIGFICQ